MLRRSYGNQPNQHYCPRTRIVFQGNGYISPFSDGLDQLLIQLANFYFFLSSSIVFNLISEIIVMTIPVTNEIACATLWFIIVIPSKIVHKLLNIKTDANIKSNSKINILNSFMEMHLV